MVICLPVRSRMWSLVGHIKAVIMLKDDLDGIRMDFLLYDSFTVALEDLRKEIHFAFWSTSTLDRNILMV